MQVFINEQEIGAIPADGATVGEVIAALAVHVPIDHVVTEIDLDGERFHGGGDEGYARRPSRAVDRLRIRTRGPEALSLELQGEVAAALAIVAAKVDRVVDLFSARDARAAQALLAELVEELHLALVLEERAAALVGQDAQLPIHDFESVGMRLVESQERGASEETARLLASDLKPLLDKASRLLGGSRARQGNDAQP
jgi:hypothetical protein